MRSITSVMLISCALTVTASTAQIPLGEDFQVNSFTTGQNGNSAVAANAQGDFVVVWDSDGSYGTDSSGTSIQGQRFGAGGAPLGGQFQINSYTNWDQIFPAVAATGQGSFVVVWQSGRSPGNDSNGTSIQVQLFDADGAPLGGQFQANSYTTGDQQVPAVAVDAQGNFVVVWDSPGSYGTDKSWKSIQGQRYDAAGTPLGGEFQVNTYTPDKQADPAVAMDTQGGFVVVWDSNGSPGNDSDSGSIIGQRFDAAGTPLGDEFQVNSFTTGGQTWPKVATDAEGDFVVVWNGPEVQAQRYEANGTPAGDQFQVNTYTKFTDPFPKVASDAQGNFVVSWWSYGSYGTDTSYSSSQGQFFNADGIALGGQFQVNSYTPGHQARPAAAADGKGRFIVAWEGYGSETSPTSPDTGIMARRFVTNLIFSDNFESGDLSAWPIVE